MWFKKIPLTDDLEACGKAANPREFIPLHAVQLWTVQPENQQLRILLGNSWHFLLFDGPKDITRTAFPMVFWYFLSGNHLGAGRLLSPSPSPPQTTRDRAHFGPWIGKQVTELAKQQVIGFGANFCNALQCCLPAMQLAAWPKRSNQGPTPGEFPLTKALRFWAEDFPAHLQPRSSWSPPPTTIWCEAAGASSISPPGHSPVHQPWYFGSTWPQICQARNEVAAYSYC